MPDIIMDPSAEKKIQINDYRDVLIKGYPALMNPPLLVEAFCHFCLAMRPKRILVTPLEELARDPDELLENRHFELVQDRLTENVPDTSVASATMEDLIEL